MTYSKLKTSKENWVTYISIIVILECCLITHLGWSNNFDLGF